MLFLLWIVPIFEPLCHCLVIQFLMCCDYQVTAKVELLLLNFCNYDNIIFASVRVPPSPGRLHLFPSVIPDHVMRPLGDDVYRKPRCPFIGKFNSI